MCAGVGLRNGNELGGTRRPLPCGPSSIQPGGEFLRVAAGESTCSRQIIVSPGARGSHQNMYGCFPVYRFMSQNSGCGFEEPTMKSRLFAAVVGICLLLVASGLAAQQISGDYLETRSAD